MIYEERLVRELPEKNNISLNDYLLLEDLDGTKLGSVNSVKNLLVNTIFCDTIESLKNVKFKEGDVCTTLGYHSINDGGSGLYKIVYSPATTQDNANWHHLYNSDVYRAKFVSLDGTVTPEQFGAYGDGEHDDSNAINKCIESGYKIKFIKSSNYRINRSLQLKNNIELDFNECTISPYNCDVFSNISNTINNMKITNCNFNMSNAKSNSVINFANKSMNSLYIDNININGGYGKDIILRGVSKLYINNSSFYHFDIKSYSIDFNNSSTDVINQNINISNCDFRNCIRAINFNTNSSDLYGVVNITSCNLFNDKIITDTTSFLYNNRNLSSSIRKKNINLNNITTNNINLLLNNIGGDNIYISDISLSNANSLLESSNTNSIINIDGNINLLGNNQNTKTPVFKNIRGKIIIGCNLEYNTSRHNEIGTNINCELQDKIGPYGRLIKDYSNPTTVSITEMKNNIFNLTATSPQISIISNGINGQVIGLKYNNAGKIITSSTISLPTQEKSVNKNETIYLKCVSGRWILI